MTRIDILLTKVHKGVGKDYHDFVNEHFEMLETLKRLHVRESYFLELAHLKLECFESAMKEVINVSKEAAKPKGR